MRIKFFDGSMGTMLQSAGLKAGELPELLNLTDEKRCLQFIRLMLRQAVNILQQTPLEQTALKWIIMKRLSEKALKLQKGGQKGCP